MGGYMSHLTKGSLAMKLPTVCHKRGAQQTPYTMKTLALSSRLRPTTLIQGMNPCVGLTMSAE